MSIKVLHISDLHFRAPAELNKNICQSNAKFCDEFINYIHGIGNIDYLIFTGDAINQGYVKAFNNAKDFLNKIIEKLGIKKNKVLLCMGNHDFKRSDLADEALEIPSDATNSQERLDSIHTSDTKYKYFKSFVADVRGKNINVKDAIYDEIIDENNKIIFLGVNTCYLESYNSVSHKGAIDKDQFIYKLKECLKDKSDYNVFLVMHHNPDPGAVGNDVYNWKEILLDIQKEQIDNPIVVFSGHIHYIDTNLDKGSLNEYDQEGKSAAVTGKDKGFYYFSAGSLLNTEYKTRSFNLYEIDDNKITYHFHTHIDAEENPDWREYKHGSIPIEKQAFTSNKAQEHRDDEEKIPGENKQIEDKLYLMNYIGRHELYYSGHFHWNTDENTEESDFKSHGYIDINYLVSHNESLKIITRLFQAKIDDIINQFKKLGKTLIIAVGMECDVIGARLSIIFPDFDFSYYPRITNDHSDIESKIGLLENNDYNTIILIKDIVFNSIKGETEKLIRKNFYEKNIHIISLFYCGTVMKEGVLKGFDKVTFHPLIDDIKIPICNVQENKCPTINYKLQTIYRC